MTKTASDIASNAIARAMLNNVIVPGGHIDRLKAGLPWKVVRHQVNHARGHIVDCFENNMATNLSLDIAEFIVWRVNQEVPT